MSTQHDALRESLGKVKAAQGAHPMAVPVLLEEAQELIEQALAASKPEPQAQAGGPEVVAIGVKCVNTGRIGPLLLVGRDDDEIGQYVPRLLVPLITLQSHREAIAQHRAVLEECVVALKKTLGVWGGTCAWHADIKSAINHANQVLGKEGA